MPSLFPDQLDQHNRDPEIAVTLQQPQWFIQVVYTPGVQELENLYYFLEDNYKNNLNYAKQTLTNNLHITDEYGNTIWHYIAKNTYNTDMLKNFLNDKDCFNNQVFSTLNSEGDTPLHIIFRFKNYHHITPENLENLLYDEQNLTIKDILNIPNNQNITPLHFICNYIFCQNDPKDIEFFNQLLNHKLIIPNSLLTQDLYGSTILHYLNQTNATSDDNLKFCFTQLIEQNLLTDKALLIPNKDGLTPLEFIIECKNTLLYKAIISNNTISDQELTKALLAGTAASLHIPEKFLKEIVDTTGLKINDDLNFLIADFNKYEEQFKIFLNNLSYRVRPDSQAETSLANIAKLSNEEEKIIKEFIIKIFQSYNSIYDDPTQPTSSNKKEQAFQGALKIAEILVNNINTNTIANNINAAENIPTLILKDILNSSIFTYSDEIVLQILKEMDSKLSQEKISNILYSNNESFLSERSGWSNPPIKNIELISKENTKTSEQINEILMNIIKDSHKADTVPADSTSISGPESELSGDHDIVWQ